MGGRRAAASTDNARAALRERNSDLGESFGSKVPDVSTVPVAGKASVWVEGQREFGRGKSLRKPQRNLGTIDAIDAQNFGIMTNQLLEGDFKRDAGSEEPIFIRGERADRRTMMKGLLHMESEEQFIEVLKCFQEDQIDSTFEQRSDLSPEALLAINTLVFAFGGRDPERTNAARHERSLRGLSGELRCLPINFIDAIRKSMPSQAHAICSKGVRFDNARAGRQVVGVNLSDEFGTRDAECLETFVWRGAALLEQRPHGAVSTEWMNLDLLKKSHCLCSRIPSLRLENQSRTEQTILIVSETLTFDFKCGDCFHHAISEPLIGFARGR